VGVANAKSVVLRIFATPTKDSIVFSTVGYVIHPASGLHTAIEGVVFVSSLVQLYLEPYLLSRSHAAQVSVGSRPQGL
jgi:hypothetical protein